MCGNVDMRERNNGHLKIIIYLEFMLVILSSVEPHFAN